MAAFSGAWWDAEGLRATRLDPPGAGGVCRCSSGVGGVAGDWKAVALWGPSLLGRDDRFRPGFFPRALPGNLR